MKLYTKAILPRFVKAGGEFWQQWWFWLLLILILLIPVFHIQEKETMSELKGSTYII
jgi:hypothetical protein